MNDSKTRMLFDGAIAGLVGATAIIAWLAIVAAAAGNLAAFAAVFGSSYLAIHYAAFAGIGAVSGLLLTEGEWYTALFQPVAIFFVGLNVFLISVVMILGPAERVALPWWNVIVGDFVALAGIATFILVRHPQIARDMREAWRGVIGVDIGVTCPQSKEAVHLKVDPETGAIQCCSRWPARYNCPRNCVPETSKDASKSA